LTGPENIFDFYREKIETRYNLWIGFLGVCSVILFLDQYFPEEQWILRGVQDALKYVSCGLVISLWMSRYRLLTILDSRYPDSLQRIQDYLVDRETKLPAMKRDTFAFLAVWLVIATISFFTLEEKKLLGFILSAIVLLPIALLVQNLNHAQNKKLFKELKEGLQRQALDIST
jgi:hypothetical protein